jgi:hypothetical protein
MLIPAFEAFGKIPRLNREWILTEKIDGTNGQIQISDITETYLRSRHEAEDELWGLEGKCQVVACHSRFYVIQAGSRNKWIGRHDDNHGFANWVFDNAQELAKLGPGRHFGEWWGKGIQRGYGLTEKRFSLFNTHRWSDPAVRPECCDVVPVLATGTDVTTLTKICLERMRELGSIAAPGFKRPEGIIAFHTASNSLFKATLERDEEPKGLKVAA